MYEELNKKGYNRDVPIELTIHYIVKDYRRMFHMHEQMKNTIAELRDILRKRENEVCQKNQRIEKLKGRVANGTKQYEALLNKLNRHPDGVSVSLHKHKSFGYLLTFFDDEDGHAIGDFMLSREELASLHSQIGCILNQKET